MMTEIEKRKGIVPKTLKEAKMCIRAKRPIAASGKQITLCTERSLNMD